MKTIVPKYSDSLTLLLSACFTLLFLVTFYANNFQNGFFSLTKLGVDVEKWIPFCLLLRYFEFPSI